MGVVAEQGRGGRCPGVQADRACYAKLRGAVLHCGAQVERGVALQRGTGHCGERCQLWDGQPYLGLWRTGGLRGALCSQQRMPQREFDRTVGGLEVSGGIQSERRCREQVRWSAGDAQPFGRRMDTHQALVARNVCDEALHAAATAVDLVELQPAIHGWSGEGTLHAGIEGDGLPGDVGPRGHRRCVGSDRQVGGAVHEVHGALRTRIELTGTDRKTCCDASRGPSSEALIAMAPRSGSFATSAISPCGGSSA